MHARVTVIFLKKNLKKIVDENLKLFRFLPEFLCFDNTLNQPVLSKPDRDRLIFPSREHEGRHRLL
jgi:hypothetical protein